MRVLLDECVPRRLRRELPGLDVSTVDLLPLMPRLLDAIRMAAPGRVLDVSS